MAGEPVSGSGGGGGDLCDPDQVWQMTYPPLPEGTKQFSFQFGYFMGPSSEELVLQLPVGDRLSELDPAFGGELDLDLEAQANGLSYRFTKLSAGIDRFILDLQPANEAARTRPLGSQSPKGDLLIEGGLCTSCTISDKLVLWALLFWNWVFCSTYLILSNGFGSIRQSIGSSLPC